MMSKPYVLVIGGRDFSIGCFNELDIEYTLFQNGAILTEDQVQWATTLEVTELGDYDQLLSLAQKHHQRRPFCAVFAFSEQGLMSAAKIAAELGVASNCVERTVHLAGDKIAMREAIKKTSDHHTLNIVNHRFIESLESLEQFIDEGNLPCIVKPADGVGSRGVHIVRQKQEAVAAFAYSSEHGKGPLIAEKFIGGREFSVESFSRNGEHQILMVTEKVTTGAPHFVETGHNQPAPLSAALSAQVHQCVLQLLELIGHQSGPCHTEVKIDQDKVYIIETQPRTGGHNIWEMTQLLTGINLFKETIVTVLGLPPLAKEQTYDAASMRFFQLDQGIVKTISGVEQAAAESGVHRLEIAIKPGDSIAPAFNTMAQPGFVVTVGSDRQQAINIAEQVSDMVRFEIV